MMMMSVLYKTNTFHWIFKALEQWNYISQEDKTCYPHLEPTGLCRRKNDNKQHTVKWYDMNKGDKYHKAIHVPYGLTYHREMKTPSS